MSAVMTSRASNQEQLREHNQKQDRDGNISTQNACLIYEYITKIKHWQEEHLK